MEAALRFCKRWDRTRRRAVLPINHDEARLLNEAGEPFVVIVGDVEPPLAFLEIGLGAFGVSFLDSIGREELMYTYERVGDKLFLAHSTFRVFLEDTGDVKEATTYRFDPKGHVWIRVARPSRQEVETSEGPCSVEGNWAQVPAFGRYEELLRRER